MKKVFVMVGMLFLHFNGWLITAAIMLALVDLYGSQIGGFKDLMSLLALIVYPVLVYVFKRKKSSADNKKPSKPAIAEQKQDESDQTRQNKHEIAKKIAQENYREVLDELKQVRELREPLLTKLSEIRNTLGDLQDSAQQVDKQLREIHRRHPLLLGLIDTDGSIKQLRSELRSLKAADSEAKKILEQT